MIFVVSGPGGVGKGTIVANLMNVEPSLWLSRSWTTRPQRLGEQDDAYEFVSEAEFQSHIDTGGFIEWVEFLGNRYGSPIPQPNPGEDILLEIELRGAQRIRTIHPDAVLVLVVPPSEDEQRMRLQRRGDGEERVEERIRIGRAEMDHGHEIADEIVVNDDLETAVRALADIIEKYRGLKS